jgi:alpha-tubulin suppressor-like RCC1 family protein
MWLLHDAGGSTPCAVFVSVAENHACTLLQDGSVSCAGRNKYGELGTGKLLPYPDTIERFTTATSLCATEGGNVTGVASLYDATCILGATPLNGDNVYCVGSGSEDRLGDNTTSDSLVPVTASLRRGQRIRQLAAHADDAVERCSLFLPLRWGAGPMALMLWLNLVI